MRFLILLIITISISICTPFLSYKAAESVTFEAHDVLPGENMTVGGFIYQRYITDHWFWGGAGYGALLGQRGGYFIGGFLLGYTQFIGKWFIEPQVYLGAGGGHSAPAGMSSGGLIRNSLSLGYMISPSLFIKGHIGHINFVQGTINSWLVGFSIGSFHHEIYSH